jgi:hypothetical protein
VKIKETFITQKLGRKRIDLVFSKEDKEQTTTQDISKRLNIIGFYQGEIK